MMHAACLGAVCDHTAPFGSTTGQGQSPEQHFVRFSPPESQNSLRKMLLQLGTQSLLLQGMLVTSAGFPCFPLLAVQPSQTPHTDTAACTSWHHTLHPLLSHPQPRGAACTPNPCISSYCWLGR